MLTESTIADIARQVGAVDRHFRRRFPSFADDIRQEAWKAALDAAPRYRASNPGARGYFYRVAACHAGQMVNRWLAVTSLSSYAVSKGAGARQVRAPVKDSVDAGVRPDIGAYLPCLRDAQRDLARLRVRWRRAVEAAARKLPDDVREIGFLAIGLDAPRCSAADIADALGVELEDIKRALKTFTRATHRNPLVVALSTQIENIEENLP